MKIEKVFRKDLQAWRWKIDITINGERIRRADFQTKSEAMEAIGSLLNQAKAARYGLIKPKPGVTLQGLYDQLEEDLASRRRSMMIRFREFVSLLGGERELASLTRADWKTYASHIQQRSLKPQTINSYIGQVAAALNRAADYFPDLADWRAPKAPYLPASQGRERLLSGEEVSRLIRALRADRYPGEYEKTVAVRLEALDLFRLMLLTGAREGEILHLKQSQVSWDWRTVRITSTKGTGGALTRVIPLSDSALRILRSRMTHAPGFFKPFSIDTLYRSLARVCNYAGIAYGRKESNGWILYDTRHLAATILENSGVPYSAVSAILGHKRRDMTATYAHVTQETLRRGVTILENHCRDFDGFFSESEVFDLSPQTQATRA